MAAIAVEKTAVNAPYWDGLAAGALKFQACGCGHRWLPPREACPACLRGDQWSWREAGGRARLVSWVVYHTAYHPAFADRVPYNVALVELDEGPRMITNILAPNAALAADMRLALRIEDEGGIAVARFAPSGAG